MWVALCDPVQLFACAVCACIPNCVLALYLWWYIGYKQSPSFTDKETESIYMRVWYYAIQGIIVTLLMCFRQYADAQREKHPNVEPLLVFVSFYPHASQFLPTASTNTSLEFYCISLPTSKDCAPHLFAAWLKRGSPHSYTYISASNTLLDLFATSIDCAPHLFATWLITGTQHSFAACTYCEHKHTIPTAQLQ